jgi:hypothetical protein
MRTLFFRGLSGKKKVSTDIINFGQSRHHRSIPIGYDEEAYMDIASEQVNNIGLLQSRGFVPLSKKWNYCEYRNEI